MSGTIENQNESGNGHQNENQNENPFPITESPIPLPDEACAVDLAESFAKIVIRCSRLETSLESERRQARRTLRELLLGVLEIDDALDRIAEDRVEGEDPAIALARCFRNILSTRRLLTNKLNSASVRPMDLRNSVLNPAVADVEGYQLRPDLPDETILEEIMHGYWLSNEVLRRAKVIVSRNI